MGSGYKRYWCYSGWAVKMKSLSHQIPNKFRPMHLLISFSSFTDHPWPLLFALGAVVLAYGVFTLVGFGSALMAGGPLAMSTTSSTR